MTYVKKYLHHLFVDGVNGMAIGFFATFVWGTLLKQLGLCTSGFLSELLCTLGQLLCSLTCAGIGLGMAYKFHEGIWVSLSAAICGMIGGYATEILAGTLYVGGAIRLSSSGQPLSAFVSAYIGIEIGHLIASKTRLDSILTPAITIGTGAATGLLLGPHIASFSAWFGSLISWGTEQNPLVMGIVISTLMALASILPLQAVIISTSLPLTGLAAGAATAGCCCCMIGLAIASHKDNHAGGFISQSLGSSSLQLANILRKPIIFLPILLTSAILGPISTIMFQMTNTALGVGLGTLGFHASISTFQHMTQSHDAFLVVIKIILLHFLLPGAFTYLFSEWMRAQKWIKLGDMKIDM